MSKTVLEGPVFPLVTPFIKDQHGQYPVDFSCLRGYIDFLLDGGGVNIMVASATSRFAQLTEAEIRAINEATVSQVGNRGLAIASTGIMGSTALHVETAQHAESIGAKVIACEYPWRFQSVDATLAYFRAIVENTDSIKIMLHVTPGRSELGGMWRYDIDSLDAVCSLPRVIGMKEAAGDPEHAREIWKHFSDRTSIIVAGKGSQSYYESVEHGAAGYFVGTGNLMPGISMRIWELLRDGKREEAKSLIEQHELPFLKTAKSFGWHAALKAGLAELGLMTDTERPPMAAITTEQRNTLAGVMKDCGWLNVSSRKSA